jgi:hypothetical protein
MSFDNIRVGKKYWLLNFGETTEFQVLKALNNNDFTVQDLYSLEKFRLSELIKYGRGKDFELEEIEKNN